MLDSMSSWVTLTPATLFLFLNLVIGTIAVASRFGSHHRPPHHHQLQGNDAHHHQYQQLERPPSLLERVRSGNFPLYRYPPADSEHEYPAQTLQRPPSFLERVKSIDFSSYYRSEPQTGFTHEHDSHYLTGRVTEYNNTSSHGAPSVLERVKSIGFSSFYASHHLETSADEPGYENDRVDPPKLERGPSLLQRVKSIKLPSLYRYDDAATESGSDLYDENGSGVEPHQVTRSRTEPRKKQAANPKMKKSASVRVAAAEEEEEEVERRRPTTTKVEKTNMFGDEEVDAKADDFINRFKQQLKLQRLDSLLRYKEIITGK